MNILKRITEFNSDRLPEYVAIKYQLLQAGPFRFFRGTCHLFYEDLAKHITWKDPTKCWITGDLHLENFGAYKGDDKIVYFDMNDFDEACLAPATWELARLLTSIHLAAAELGLDAKEGDNLCSLCMDTYINTLLRGKPWVIEKETAKGLLHYFISNLQHRKRAEFLKSRIITGRNGISLRIDNAKTFPLSAEIKNSILNNGPSLLKTCRQLDGYVVKDAVFRLAGTGSVGLERYALLVQHTETGKIRVADMKEATQSSLCPFLAQPQPRWKNEAERISVIQHFAEHVAPALLQPVKMGAKYYVLKALQPTQDRMDLALCKKKAGQLEYMIITMARLAASGQLRSGGRFGSSITDELIAFAKGSARWKSAVGKYAKAYALKVSEDYREFCAAIQAKPV